VGYCVLLSLLDFERNWNVIIGNIFFITFNGTVLMRPINTLLDSAGLLCVFVCVREREREREGQTVSECPLESPPPEGVGPVIVRPLLLSKRRPHLKTRKSLGKNKNMAETKIDCAGEVQQLFTGRGLLPVSIQEQRGVLHDLHWELPC
jgi:hypothetical protein